MSPTSCVVPEVIDRARSIERDWLVECSLALRVAIVLDRFQQETGRTPRVISGFRSRAEQQELTRQGRPTADDDKSNHRVYPARAVDVSLGPVPTNAMKWTFGRIAVEEGLRWGGGSPLDDDGLPIDWQHLDRGPRPPGLASA